MGDRTTVDGRNGDPGESSGRPATDRGGVLPTDDRGGVTPVDDRGGRAAPGVSRRTVLGNVGLAAAGSLGVVGTVGAQVDTVQYGVLSPITGPFAGLAQEQRRGAELAIDFVNDSDEYEFTIDATFEDTETTPETGRRVASRVVGQGADFIMGAISSSVALALNEFAADEEVIYTPGAAAIPITGEQCNRYVFRAETNTAQIAEAAAPWTLENLGSDVWFHIADYAYGQSVLQEWRSRMEDADAEFETVGVSRAVLGATNFDPFITEIGNSDADVVVVGSTGGDLINFISQAANQGLKDELAIMTTTGSFQVVRGATGPAATDVYSGVRYVPALETGDNQEFVGLFEERHDEAPDNFARVAFDSIRMVANGIREAGSADPEVVADTLPDLEMETLFGPNAFRACDHQATNPVWVGQNVAPESGETTTVELLERVEGEDAIPPCEETGCEL